MQAHGLTSRTHAPRHFLPSNFGYVRACEARPARVLPQAVIEPITWTSPIRGYRLMTRDKGLYEIYFPKLSLIAP